MQFKLAFKFPTSYPYEAPQVTFVTPCFHPNVDQYGNICLDILKASASPPPGAAARSPPPPPPPPPPLPPPPRPSSPARRRRRSQEKWTAAYNVRTILLSIQSLLGDPNLDSPLNGHAAAIWHKTAEYKAALQKHKSQQAPDRRA